MTRLSVCMIVKNEADCLADCLTSVMPIADELVVVDTGSSDATKAIAAGFGARLLDYVWHDDFAAARNVSLEAAQGDWILVIDADERLDPASLPLLRDFLAEPELACVKLRIQSPYDNGEALASEAGSGQYNYSLVRLFPNRETLRFRRAYHEVIFDAQEPQLPVRLLSGLRLLHSGYDGERPLAKAKAERNRALIDSLCQKEPENPIWRYYSANAWATAAKGRPGPEANLALAAFEALLNQGAELRCLDQDFFYPHALIEAMSLCRAEPERGLKLAERFGLVAARHPDYWYMLGTLRRRSRDPEGAIACFEACLTLGAYESDFDFCYSPLCLDRGPLLQLLQMHRVARLNPALPGLARHEALKAWLETCRRALRRDPGNSQVWLTHLLEALALARKSAYPNAGETWLVPVVAESSGSRDHLGRLIESAARLNDLIAGLSSEPARTADQGAEAELLRQLVDQAAGPARGGFDTIGLADQLMPMAARALFAALEEPGWMLALANWQSRRGQSGQARQQLLEARLLMPHEASLQQALQALGPELT